MEVPPEIPPEFCLIDLPPGVLLDVLLRLRLHDQLAVQAVCKTLRASSLEAISFTDRLDLTAASGPTTLKALEWMTLKALPRLTQLLVQGAICLTAFAPLHSWLQQLTSLTIDTCKRLTDGDLR